MFAVLTHSRLRGVRSFPQMLRATLAVREDLRRARGLLRAANVIAGPTEFLTLTVWSDRDAMYAFMRSGAHERIMWRWPEWLSAFWLGRLAPTDWERGTWRGMSVARAAARGGPAHAEFVAPAFASHEQRPRDLERYALGVTTTVIRPRAASAWPRAIGCWRAAGRSLAATPELLLRAGGYSLDGELVHVALWRDDAAAASALAAVSALSAPGVRAWTMAWRPLDEFGTWDGLRVRRLLAGDEAGDVAVGGEHEARAARRPQGRLTEAR